MSKKTQLYVAELRRSLTDLSLTVARIMSALNELENGMLVENLDFTKVAAGIQSDAAEAVFLAASLNGMLDTGSQGDEVLPPDESIAPAANVMNVMNVMDIREEGAPPQATDAKGMPLTIQNLIKGIEAQGGSVWVFGSRRPDEDDQSS